MDGEGGNREGGGESEAERAGDLQVSCLPAPSWRTSWVPYVARSNYDEWVLLLSYSKYSNNEFHFESIKYCS